MKKTIASQAFVTRMNSISYRLATHSVEWFAECFGSNKELVPADLRNLSTQFCTSFGIKGVSDPMYIANVAALEFARGNGTGSFFLANKNAHDDFDNRLSSLANRLRHSYSRCVSVDEATLRSLLETWLQAPPTV